MVVSTIGHTGDTDLITVASGIATVAGEVSMTTLDIGGTNVTSTAAEVKHNGWWHISYIYNSC